MTRTPASRSGPAAAIRSAVARIAMELTVCQHTPSSAAMAEMVVRSIINRRTISGTAARRGRSWGCQRAQVLIEHRTATLWGQTAVAGHGYPQHQRIASDRQIGQRPGHGVAVSACGPAVRAARIAGHRTAEDPRLLLVDGSVGDRHPQFDGAHDRVGNNRRRAGSSLRHGSPRWHGRSSVGTRIVTHRGPTSAQRHDRRARISADHRCILIHEEPIIVGPGSSRWIFRATNTAAVKIAIARMIAPAMTRTSPTVIQQRLRRFAPAAYACVYATAWTTN